MSQSLAEQAQRIQAVRDKFSQQCKQADDVVKRLQANKRDSLNKTQAVSDMLFELLSLVGGQNIQNWVINYFEWVIGKSLEIGKSKVSDQ